MGVFNVGPEKILLILLIALIVLGPEELPGVARKIGNVMRELRRMSTGFESELRSAFDQVTSHSPSDRTAGQDHEPSAEPGAEPHEADSAA